MRTSRLPVPALVAGIAISLALPALAHAQGDDTVDVTVNVSGNTHVKLGADISRVSVGSSDVADVAAFPPDQLLVTGRRPGTTNATVWTRTGVKTVRISVEYPNDLIRKALKKALPDAKKLEVASAGASLVLSGEVSSAADIETAEKVARSLVAGVLGSGDVPVVNLLRVPGNQQVQLEVSFAEVSRSALRQIGFNFWSKHTYSSGRGFAGGMTNPTTSLDGLAPELSTTPDVGNLNHGEVGFDADGLPLTDTVPLVGNPVTGAFGFIFSSTLGGFPFSAALSLMSSKGYSRTLAEPTLVAMSGKSASFLAGGEFPIPIPQSLGQVSIEFRKFGIQLEFTPTVIGSNIQLALAMTVSDIDQSLGVRLNDASVPGLTSRHSQTTIRLQDGQSFVIAGLLSDRVRSSVDKVPFLGELPILGALFRSSSYRRDETELLVVVTAHRVAPLNEKPELPGQFATTDPSDLELFLLGKGESIDTGDDSSQRRRKPRGKKKRKPVGAVGFRR